MVDDTLPAPVADGEAGGFNFRQTIVQMVQRSPAAGAGEERAHIDRSIERNQVLSRLRSALPAARNSGI